MAQVTAIRPEEVTRSRRDGANARSRRRLNVMRTGVLIAAGLFFLVPLALIVAYSFWQTVDYNVVHHWTLGNYRYFFSVSTYVKTTWATLWVAALATAITIAIAFPFAYWLARYVSRRYQGVLLVLVILPFWTSYLLRVYSWLNILGEKGALNRFLEWTGITNQPVSFFLYDRPAVVLVLVYLYFPFAALTLSRMEARFSSFVVSSATRT